MVHSDVEYIDEDVEAAATSEQDDRDRLTWELAAVSKLLLPVTATIFAMLYANSVVGRIAISNLYYPLFVVSSLLVLLVTVYINEFIAIYRLYENQQKSFRSDAMSVFEEWWQSIGLLLVTIGYLYSVPVLGFFSASAVAMVVLMPLGGYRDWRLIVGTTVGVLLLIYGLFVVAANLQPPRGLLL